MKWTTIGILNKQTKNVRITCNDSEWGRGKCPWVILLWIVEGINDIKEQFEAGLTYLWKQGALAFVRIMIHKI